MTTLTQRLFLLEPQYRERVWGGRRLKASDPPVGEAWVAFEESLIRGGAQAGLTVARLAADYGEQFLGSDVAERFGARFPLLVKLLDCADWLSVQVHPDDEQAARLVGPGAFGKTEAWYFLEAEEGATVYAGVRPGTTRDGLARAIRDGRILDVSRRLEVRAGQTLYIPAGTLHSLGPGLLLYEVQQASDTTFRVYDWDRPASAGRSLHIEESVAVADPDSAPVPAMPQARPGSPAAAALSCDYFELDVVRVGDTVFECDTGGGSFHVLTLTEGEAEVSCGGEAVRLERYETALVAGGAGAYRLRSDAGGAQVLRASVPPRSGRVDEA